MQNKRLSVRQYYFGEFKELNISDNAPFKFIIEGTDCYCYNIDFAHLLTTDKIIKNNLKPIDFIQDFKNGFVEGLLHLETKESIKRSDFYDQNKRELLQGQLEFILYRKEYPDGYTGLVEFTQIVPLLFTSKVIHKTGYYNGLIHSVLTLANDLNLKVTDSRSSQSNANNNLTAKQKALIAIYTNQRMTREKDGNNTYNQFLYFLKKQNRIAGDTDIKIKNRLKLFESLLKHLPQDKQRELLSEIQTVKSKI